MGAPTPQAFGTPQSGIGSLNVAWPAHQADDIGLLIIECDDVGTDLNPSGWTHVPGSPLNNTLGAGSNLHILWKRASSSSEADAVTGDSGDHQCAVIVTFRGCVTSGDPWDAIASSLKNSLSTTVTCPTVTTTVADTLVVLIASRHDDSASTTAFGAFANANLTGIGELGEMGTTAGGGGGAVVAYGTKATAGSVGTSTCTVVNSINVNFTIALKPETGSVGSSSGTGTATGVGQAQANAVGASTGTGTATGAGQAQANSVGSSIGSSEAIGIGKTYAYTVGSSSGSSSVNGVGDDAGAITPEPEPELIEYLGGMPDGRAGRYDFLNPPDRGEKQRSLRPAKKTKGLDPGRQREKEKSRPPEPNQSALSGADGIDALSKAIDALRIAEAEKMRMAMINDAVQTGLIGLAVDIDRMAKESEQAEEEQAILQFLFDM